MLVSDIVTDAKYSELQQLAVRDDNNAIISYINQGLLELHKRFNLRTEEAIVKLYAHMTHYTVDPAEDYVDMRDDCDLIYIQNVWEEDGSPTGLNNEQEENSILTPLYNVIQIPNPTDNAYMAVVYTATHARVTTENDVVKLPPALYEALLHYIGYKAHASLDGAMEKENNTHYMRFDKSCEAAKSRGLVLTDEIPYRPVNFKGFI